MKMVFRWGMLILWFQYAQGRQPRRNQELNANMVNQLNSALEKAQQTVSKANESDLADHSFIYPSSKSVFVYLMYMLQRNDLFPMEKFYKPGKKGSLWFGDFSEPWRRTLLGIVFPFPLVLLLLGIGASIYVWRSVTKRSNVATRDKDRSLRKPSLSTLSGFTMIMAALIFFIALCATGSAANTVYTILGVFRDVEPDLRYIEDSLAIIEPDIHNADLWLGGWIQSCPDFITKTTETLSPDLWNQFTSLNEKYVALLQNQTMTIYNVTQEIKQIPRYVEESHCLLKTALGVGNQAICPKEYPRNPLGLWTLFLLVLPTLIVLVGVCCCIRSVITHEENSFVHAGGSSVDWGFTGLACCNLCIVLISVVLLIFLLTLGLYCENSEENTVALASATNNGNGTSLAYESVSYYLTGTPEKNLIVENMRKVRVVLDQLGNALWLIKGLLDGVGVLCSHIGYVDPTALLDKAVPRVNQIIPMAKRDRVYYYYDALANRAMCDSVFNSITLTLISQLAICLFLIPIVSKRMHTYLLDMKGYQEQLKVDNANETKKLISKGWYCEDCRAEFKKPSQGKLSDADFKTQTSVYESQAGLRTCPECGSKNIKPGSRKLNLPKDDGACTTM